VAPVVVAGVATLVAACVSYGQSAHSTEDAAALAGLLFGMVLAERFPVPVEGVDAGGVSLGFVFAVAAILLFGWQAGVIVAAGGPTVTHLIGHRPPLRVAYNGSMFALAALAAGLIVEQIPESSIGALIARLAVGAFVYYWVVNLVLISAVLAVSAGKPFFKLIWDNAKQTTAPFALMTSAALMLVVLWERSPALSMALVGPLLAIALYQRSTFAALKAMRLALTDPLTGLGNHRSFHERLQRELVDAEHRAFPPLQSPREGNSLTDQSWSTIDQIAQAGGQYVFDNFAAITGCGKDVRVSISGFHEVSTVTPRSAGWPPVSTMRSFKSCPAQKPRPAPVSTTTRASPRLASASRSSACISAVKLLSRSGRLSVIRATGPLTSKIR